MASSNGMSAVGATLKFTTTGDTAFTAATTVGEVVSVNPRGLTVEKVELTHLTSDDQTEESTPGIIRPGTLEVSANFTDDEFNTLYGLLRSIRLWRLTLPDSSTYDCEGYLTSIEMDNIDVGASEGVRTNLTIQLTGKPTFTTAS